MIHLIHCNEEKKVFEKILVKCVTRPYMYISGVPLWGGSAVRTLFDVTGVWLSLSMLNVHH